MAPTTSSIEIFMGASVEYASERAVLERAYSLAAAAGIDSVILANFSVGGRQIDGLVATDAGAIMLEAKGVSQPIEGGVNGLWRMESSAGPIPMRNGYIQALEAKNALHDAMTAFAAQAPYPDARVVIVPFAPAGSNLTRGDFKAGVINLDELALPVRTGTAPWSVTQWKAFASLHSLQTVSRLPALFDPALLTAEQGLDAYGRQFLDTYSPRAKGLLAFPCEVSGATTDSGTLAARLDQTSGLILIGPSGCGKSLAGLALAMARMSAGEVPLVVEAKLFDGRLAVGLDREAALLGFDSFRSMAKASQRVGRRLLILVDGYNECASVQRFALTRALAALVRRTGAKLLVTSQIPLEGELLGAATVRVLHPPLALKAEIARAAAVGSLSPSTEALLEAASSGLEARMLGEVGGELPSGASRFALFDVYVRRRLGRLGPEGIRTLTMVAGHLAERLSFSLSVRDFDRLQTADAHSQDVLAALLEAGFLERRGDRLSFGHELFLQAFQAEALVRRASGDASEITAALKHPLFAASGSLVLGAIDDSTLLTAVLGSISDARLVAHCLSGDCGEPARVWAESQCILVFAAAQAEIDGATFEINAGALLGVDHVQTSLRVWTDNERAVLSALPDWLSRPSHLPKLLAAARAADGLLAAEHRRLAPEARERKVALRSGLFGQTFVFGGFGLSNAFGVNAGLRRWGGTLEELATVFASRADDLSFGEAHVLLELARGRSGISRLIAPQLPGLIARMWTGAPYHLKLGLLEAAGFCWQADDADRQAVIQALEDIGPIEHIMLSTQWVESMEQLGALEADAERELEVLRADMPAILAQPKDLDQQRQAWSLYYRRFDHPLSSAYCTAFDELEPSMRLQVLSMAAQVAELNTFFAGPLLADLAQAGDSDSVAPIARWAILPPPESGMFQDALANYLTANIVLARNGLEPPAQATPPEPAGQALMACADALYAANRSGLTVYEREARVAAAWDVLASIPGAALVALAECSKVRPESLRRLPGDGVEPMQIVDGQEAAVVRFARAVLTDPDLLSGWFHPQFFDPTPAILFGLEALGRWGDASDLSRLRTMTRVAKAAETALNEVRRLEDRLFKSRDQIG